MSEPAKKKCGNCGFVYEVNEKDVIDMGTAFGASFKYRCPKCRSPLGEVLEEVQP